MPCRKIIGRVSHCGCAVLACPLDRQRGPDEKHRRGAKTRGLTSRPVLQRPTSANSHGHHRNQPGTAPGWWLRPLATALMSAVRRRQPQQIEALKRPGSHSACKSNRAAPATITRRRRCCARNPDRKEHPADAREQPYDKRQSAPTRSAHQVPALAPTAARSHSQASRSKRREILRPDVHPPRHAIADEPRAVRRSSGRPISTIVIVAH